MAQFIVDIPNEIVVDVIEKISRRNGYQEQTVIDIDGSGAAIYGPNPMSRTDFVMAVFREAIMSAYIEQKKADLNAQIEQEARVSVGRVTIS